MKKKTVLIIVGGVAALLLVAGILCYVNKDRLGLNFNLRPGQQTNQGDSSGIVDNSGHGTTPGDGQSEYATDEDGSIIDEGTLPEIPEIPTEPPTTYDEEEIQKVHDDMDSYDYASISQYVYTLTRDENSEGLGEMTEISRMDISINVKEHVAFEGHLDFATGNQYVIYHEGGKSWKADTSVDNAPYSETDEKCFVDVDNISSVSELAIALIGEDAFKAVGSSSTGGTYKYGEAKISSFNGFVDDDGTAEVTVLFQEDGLPYSCSIGLRHTEDDIVTTLIIDYSFNVYGDQVPLSPLM